MKSGLWLPLFDDLADPLQVARLAAEAEAEGWLGVFVWDHIGWQAPVRSVADTWISLSAIAVATEYVKLGPMVTPRPRRRPAKAPPVWIQARISRSPAPLYLAATWWGRHVSVTNASKSCTSA